ncbi:putative protein kinase [Leishmania braziliensis MHOM/BR/75/M2904]|uniref:non-specific serine/threonine protein kinase n=2 Tax=Leishmania braziliensis TaxID=5660 RepID=A4HKG9_LEIBR|nr:putative protein kinase [Leishmania braziliensis MHOM/BR/75/M2904]KAI5687584.1 Protein kinase domain [Leishmania braziliensis]CAJ2478645.1 unnamed protein product [Leishmania braziliensis]CAJ2479068.1 unnamed protein product [Leishmania braziliensis]CAM42994.2 putative protein kinase [Leishmania braziliensis MHOM/BR/75/M2904]SYZ68699.1 protein_kinase [Leishmania braziliensis MHOM/BR/75/M2904]
MGSGLAKSCSNIPGESAADEGNAYSLAKSDLKVGTVAAALATKPSAAGSAQWTCNPHASNRGDIAASVATTTVVPPKNNKVELCTASITAGSPPKGSRSKGDTSSVTSVNDAGSPIPIRNGRGEHVGYLSLSDIIGGKDSHSKYVKLQSIGRGAYGEAYVVMRNPAYNPAALPMVEAQSNSNVLARPTQPNGLYVAKIMDLRAMMSQDRQYSQREIMCLAHTNHFAIIRYYEHYVLDSDDEAMIIITELADRGDLRRSLYNASTVRPFLEEGSNAAAGNDAGTNGSRILLSEREAGTYFVQLLLALHHISARRMIHRDIKSANVLITSRGFLKLGDFGFSQKYESTVSSENIAGTFLGTPYYLSPEMWKGKRYGKKADVWAAGVVLYEMLMGGHRPYEAGSLPELRMRVLEDEFVPPTGPPTLGTADAHNQEAGKAKFSNDMRELLASIFQKSPEKRPSAEELLHTSVMQHYLFVFEKYVQSLISADAAALAANPAIDRQKLYFPDPADQALVLQGIAEGKDVVAQVSRRTISESAAPRYEGVVFKDSQNGVWKERYLVLDGSVLTISLSKGKEAVSGGERSKRVPLSFIKSVSPCEVEDAHVRVGTAGCPTNSYRPPYAFAIAMKSTNSIVFGVPTAEELDQWMQVLMRALQID